MINKLPTQLAHTTAIHHTQLPFTEIIYSSNFLLAAVHTNPPTPLVLIHLKTWPLIEWSGKQTCAADLEQLG